MATDEKYGVEASETLAQEALKLGISEAIPIYEQLLSTYPTSAKLWKQYVEAHMSVHNEEATKEIFSRCLLNCFNIPLWRCYIQFIRRKSNSSDSQEETRQAFDFMLTYVGSDIASGPLWMEYITFLKSMPAKEEPQRTDAIRKAYQRAIVTPTNLVQQLWREYEKFENSVATRALAKALVSEYQPKYLSTRAVYRERKKYADEIDWNMLAVPPSGSSKEEQQYVAWKRFLEFEKGNPQRIEAASANKRVSFVYEQCLMYLYHYPDIWYDYASWLAMNGSVDSAIKVFNRALKALPDSDMLKYAYAELEESRGAIQQAKKVYEILLGDGTNATALSCIQFLRFLRRTEGREAAHKYFLDARTYPNCTYHVYVAYATMAFCLDKDPNMARKVFEAGMKRFINDPSYILEYVDFLSHLNDDMNIRALFERALSCLPQEKSVEVWKRYVQFEQTYGDLASMLKVEQRMKQALGNRPTLESSLRDVMSRYTFTDLCPCSSMDLDHLARLERLANNAETPSLPNEAALTTNTNGLAKVAQAQPALQAFVKNLPVVGPYPDVDFVLSVCMQTNIPTSGQTGRSKQHTPASQLSGGPAPSTSDLSGSCKTTRDRQTGKRRNADRYDDEDTATVKRQQLPRDVFQMRQLKKSRGGASSQSGSGSYGSSFSGELSGSTG